MLLEVLNLRNLIAEITLVLVLLLTVHFQQSSNLSAAIVSFVRIEGDDVTGLGTLEELLLVIVLQILGHDGSALNSQATLLGVAVLIELAQVTLQHVALLIGLAVGVLAEAALEHLHLTVDERVVDSDVVVVDGVLGVERDVELGSHGDVKHKGVGSRLLQVLRLLLLRGERLAQHVHLVVGKIFVNLVTDDLVDDVHLHCAAKLATDEAHGHHAGTEARHVGTLAVVLQFLFYVILVVILLDSNGQQTIDLIGILK